MQFFYGAGVVVIALSVFRVARAFGHPFTESTVFRLAGRIRLPLTPDIAPFAMRHAAARSRGLAVGTLAGAIVGVAIAPLFGFPLDQTALAFLAISVIGTTTGLCVVSLRTIEPEREASVARASAVGLDDYLAPARHVLVGIVIAAAIVLSSVAASAHGFNGIIVGALVLGLASFVVAEIASRRLVAQRQPAASDVELAWNDALRAQLVRDLYSTPTGFALAAAYLSVLSIGGSALSAHLLPILSVVTVVWVIAGQVVSHVFDPDRYVLRRLWPERVKAGWY